MRKGLGRVSGIFRLCLALAVSCRCLPPFADALPQKAEARAQRRLLVNSPVTSYDDADGYAERNHEWR